MKVRPAFMVVAAAAVPLSMAPGSSRHHPRTSPTTAAPATTAAPTAVTLTVWGPQEDQVDATSWLPKMEAAFEKAHPEYKMTWKNAVVSEGDAGKTVKQDPTAAADVYMFANDQLGTLVQANAIGQLPPDAVTQVKKQNSDVMVTSVTGTDGNIYGVPYTANTWFMYYNASKYSKDDVKSLDTMLSKGKVAFSVDNGWYLPSLYVGNGATLFGPQGTDEAAGFDFSGQKATDVTTYLTGLVKNKNFVNDASGAGLAGLQNGTIDAYFSGTWDAAAVKTALGANMGATQPPSFTLNGAPVQMKSFAGSKAVAFNPNAKDPKAASLFAAFLGSTDAQQAHYDMRGIVPSDKSLANSAPGTAPPGAGGPRETRGPPAPRQPTVPKMGNFWDPTAACGKALRSGDVTAANAADKTAAWNTALNS